MKNKIKSYGLLYTFRALMMFIVACLVTTSCSARTSINEKSNFIVKDSVMRKAVGDSIYNIIIDAKKVVAVVKLKTSDNKNDSTINVKVNKMDKYVLNFILTAPSNYESNDTVWGKYFPNFSLNFTASKGRKCSANFDFGLKKWNISDAKGNEIVIFDMPTNDVLRLANKLFPEFEYFNVLLNTSK